MTRIDNQEYQKTKWIEAAFDGLGLAVITVDHQGKIAWLNQKALDLLEGHYEKTIGHSLMEMLTGCSSCERQALDHMLGRVLGAGEHVDSVAIVLEGKSGVCKHLKVGMSSLRTELGRVSGAVVSMSEYEFGQKTGGSSGENQSPMSTALPNGQPFYVRTEGRYVRVQVNELLWVEAMENYVLLQTTKEKMVLHSTMKNIGELLLSRGFQRIHRSYIVNVAAIECIEESHVRLQGSLLPIGKSHRTQLLEGLTLV